MSKFFSTTFGKISGKHGTAVASIVNGESILRVYTPPANPNSVGQLTQRMKFGLVITSLNPLRAMIIIGFCDTRGFNLAVSYALRNAVTGTYPDLSIDYAKVLLSSGSLQQSSAVNVSKLTGTKVAIVWDPVVWANASPDDTVHLAFLNPDNKTVVFVQAQAIRSLGRLEPELPSIWVGSNVHSWIFFTSPDGQQSSVSQYIGTVQL
jgi:hypothetical protein